MEDLIKLIVQQVNITEEQAKGTINTMLGYVRDNVPAPIAAQLETFLAGGGVTQLPGISDVVKMVGDVAQSVGDTLGSSASSATSSGTDPKLNR